jgi:N-acetylmuramoyl-L-alanine amidase
MPMGKKQIWLLCAAAVYCLAYSLLQAGSVLQTLNLHSDRTTVVIDAGHGGEDGGAVSASGVQESQLNLQFALRLRDLFAFAGVRTSLIRDADVSVYSGDCGTIAEKKVSDLKNRAKIVNDMENPLLISLHQNFYPESKYRGTQTFFAGTAGSEALAQLVQDTVRERVDPNNHRQIKKAVSVYLMEHIRCTGILVECGFLSNPEEAALLQTEAYQKRLSAAICGAAVIYLNQGRITDEV